MYYAYDYNYLIFNFLFCEMIKKTALVVIYNHNFEKNIPKINKYYEWKYDKIFHLMPFSSYEDDSVISVKDNGRFFYNFIYQAYPKLLWFDDYIITWDDCLINSSLNSDNIKEYVWIWNNKKEYSYIEQIYNPLELPFWQPYRWFYWITSLKNEKENLKYLPSWDQIVKNYEGISNRKIKSQISVFKIFFETIKNKALNSGLIYSVIWSLFSTKWSMNFFNFIPHYPLIWWYSDFLMMDWQTLKDFVNLIPIFRSYNIFAEIAIPTILVYLNRWLIIGSNTNHPENHKWNMFWTEKDYEILDKVSSIEDIAKTFNEKDLLFIHPLKLSKINI